MSATGFAPGASSVPATGFRRVDGPAPRDERVRRAGQRRDLAFQCALIAADALAALLVVLLGLTWGGDNGPAYGVALLVALVPLTFAGTGLYQRDERLINKSTLDEGGTLFQAATLVALVAFLVESTLLRHPIGATAVGTTWLGLVTLIPACRAVARRIARTLLPPERCLVIGDHELGRRVAAKLASGSCVDAEVVAIASLDIDEPVIARRQLATYRSLAHLITLHDAHRVVIAAGAESTHQELESIQAAKSLGVKVSVLPRVLEVVGSSGTYDQVDGLTLLSVPRFGIRGSSQLIKRAFDLVCSAGLLVLAAPLILVIAVAVKLTSAGPILFRQTRVGRGGRPFSILKFRSMCADAERLKDGLRHRNETEGLFKIADDPRITSVGRILRRSWLDELPQLINVLRGEMSLVGPRPLVPDEDSQIKGWHRQRLHLTPGLTGPWQVLGSGRIPLGEMVAIDYLYVADWSLWNDVKILLRTVGAVLARQGR